MKQPPSAFVIATVNIVHRCPYQYQDAHLALCYINSQDIEHKVCYGCSHVDVLKHDLGLRTFRRVLKVARCRFCNEPLTLHDHRPPHKGKRVSWCPGFEPEDLQPEVVHIPMNQAGTEWMVVICATGERLTLAEWKERCAQTKDAAFLRATDQTPEKLRRFRLPLVGAPLQVEQTDRMTVRREQALEEAEATRKRLQQKLEPKKQLKRKKEKK